MKAILSLVLVLSGYTASAVAIDNAESAAALLVVNETDENYWLAARVAPIYPPRMGRRGKQGCVNVSFIVQPDGSVTDPLVIKARPKSGFTESAIEAALQFKFTATASNVDRIPVRTGYTFVYLLKTSYEHERIREHKKWLKRCIVDLTQEFQQ